MGTSPLAQRVIRILAQEEARRLHATQLQPEHLLLGVLRTRSEIIHQIFVDLALSVDSLRNYVISSVKTDRESFPLGDIPPSTRCKFVLERSSQEATQLGRNLIDVEHILLACCNEEYGIVAQFFKEHEILVNNIRLVVQMIYSEKVSSKSDVKEHGFPTLKKNQQLFEEYSVNLTEMARQKKLDPVVGRSKEIRQLMRVLIRRNKNSPVLVGEPGIGKTSIIEGFAQRIADKMVPSELRKKQVYSLDLGRLIAGTKYRGEFEERLKKIIKELQKNKDIIVFIDEIHTIVGAGGAEGAIDASNMLKPALSRREIQCIGATTLAEYRKYFERDSALERRFQMILVEPPTVSETVDILEGIACFYEEHHSVSFTHEALVAAVELSQRYIHDRSLPDKAIDIIDEAGAKKRIADSAPPKEVLELDREIDRLNAEKIALVTMQKYEKAAEIRDEVQVLRNKIEQIYIGAQKPDTKEWKTINEEDVYTVVSDLTGIPLTRIALSESKRLLGLEETLYKCVVGQEKAIQTIASAIRRSRVGIHRQKRPIGSFLFLGPTGVGKTFIAKVVADYLFNNKKSLIRIDMSDYMEKHSVARLIGSPPGYVGYEEGGVLTERIRRKPYSVVLFDEIEKAHHDVYNILLQVLEEGELQDNLGHTISFHNTVIIITSNVGSEQMFNDRMGFSKNQKTKAGNPSVNMTTLSHSFRPEFLNRLDDIVMFHALEKSHMRQIVKLMIDDVSSGLHSMQIKIRLTRSAMEYLVEKGHSSRFGARNLRRLISREIEDEIATGILEGRYQYNSEIKIGAKNDELRFSLVDRSEIVTKQAQE